jgi:hypothetical protein
MTQNFFGRLYRDHPVYLESYNRKLDKKRGSKIYAFFVDLKAAFDNVERDLLWEYLRKKGINEHLVTKIERSQPFYRQPI